MKEASGSLLKCLGQGFQAPRAIFCVCSSILLESRPLLRTSVMEKPSRVTRAGDGCWLLPCWQGLKSGSHLCWALKTKKKKKKVSVLHPALISLNCISLILH